MIVKSYDLNETGFGPKTVFVPQIYSVRLNPAEEKKAQQMPKKRGGGHQNLRLPN